ncbi:amino acid permease [Pseudomonas sp. NFACC13-1]|uniref:amino acid permease n=1 Tax=Pseudomonas sp. NFACC13-1 TaxID=1566245 RepID=UPI001C4090DD|nr:amino acid permease [Pseudomonas sp. NFACC13-1]
MTFPPTQSQTATTEPLKRQFKMHDAFTLAFVYISPIVALYAVFGLIVQAAGPAGWWVFPIGLCLQLLIALSLGVMVSRWPLQGGSYQWARRLLGDNLGWITGWFYIWTLILFLHLMVMPSQVSFLQRWVLIRLHRFIGVFCHITNRATLLFTHS